MLARIAAVLPLLLVAACNWGYGEKVERPAFGSAVLREDGVQCVFTLNDLVYRPAEGLRAFPDGGVPRYLIDRNKIASVDVRSGELRVLVDEKNRDWLNGHGGFHLVGAAGRFALVRQYGQSDYDAYRSVWWKLDLESGERTVLPLDEEFAAQAREIARVAIADPRFHLIVVTKKDERPQEVWSRSDTGALRRLARTDHYYGVAQGEIWWYDVDARAGARTDYVTGETLHERRANFALPRTAATQLCRAAHDGRSLVFQQQRDGEWHETAIDVDPVRLR